MSTRGRTPAEQLEHYIGHLESLGDKQGETLEQRIERTTLEEAHTLITLWTGLFRSLLRLHSYEDRRINALIRKFRDAGRRSPPWLAGSETGKRRPQDGADGNRRNRWLFDPDHKFYASEDVATLCEVRYFLQTLSMHGAPEIPNGRLEDEFLTILGHPLKPGKFLDPIQKIPVEFQKFIENPRYIESGHIVPLGRDGRHTPDNATLMLRDSNRLQADLTVAELLEVMTGILTKHGYQVSQSVK
jgi:hypothetical protein